VHARHSGRDGAGCGRGIGRGGRRSRRRQRRRRGAGDDHRHCEGDAIGHRHSADRDPEDSPRRLAVEGDPDPARRALHHRGPVGEQRAECADVRARVCVQPARLHDGRDSARRPELWQLQWPGAAAGGDFGECQPHRRGDGRRRPGDPVEQQPRRHRRDLFCQPRAEVRDFRGADRRQLQHLAHLRPHRHGCIRRRRQQFGLCVGGAPARPRLGFRREPGRLAGERQVRARRRARQTDGLLRL